MRTRVLSVVPLVCLLLSGFGAAQRAPSVIWQPLPPKNPDAERVLRPVGPPMSLTSSDGTGLVLQSITARSVIEDPLAFTELRLVFRNPEPRQIEGQFEITLPPGAAISRFAMRLGDRWQEGEVVELQAARAAYEDFLHRRQDPALLEKQAGNQFRARVFPIPPSGEKELILSYSEERTRADQPYRIYLRGLPRLSRLDIRAILAKSATPGGLTSSLGGTAVTHQSVEVQKADFQPDVDFEVAVPVPPPSKQSWSGVRHENLLVARVQPFADLAENDLVAAPMPTSVTVLFDTSASRALGYGSQVDVLGSLVTELRKRAGGAWQLRVVAFDQETEEIFAGRADGFGAGQLQRLRDRRALGASDLERTLRQLASVGGSRGGVDRVILVTDGVATAGDSEAPGLQKLVRDLAQVGTKRLDVVRVGGIHDDTMLGRLVTAGLSQDGVQLEGDLPAPGLVGRLLRPTYSKIQVAVPGSQWVWPVELSGVQPGDEFLVYADLPAGGAEPHIVLSGPGLGSVDRPITAYGVTRPLLERSWVGARIKRLMYQRDTMAAQDADLREALRHQIIDLSTKFRVLSDFTALLVLETEADYERFKIDRRALTDIMTVGPTGIELLGRKNQVAIAPPPPPPPQPVLMPMAQEATKGDRSRVAVKKEAKMSMSAPADAAMAGAASPPAAEPRRAMDMDKRRPNKDVAAGPAMAQGAPAPSTPAASPSPPGAMEREEARPSPPPPPPPPPRPMPSAKPRPSAGAAASKTVESGIAAADDRGDMMERRRDMVVSPRRPPMQIASGGRVEPPPPPAAEPYEGRLREVMDLLKQKRPAEALKSAQKWRDEDAGDVLALIGLGETYEVMGQLTQAARAYGSIIDLFPGRADLRRFAGSRLERVAVRYSKAMELAADTFRKAKESRADHPNSHRFLAYSLVRLGRYAEALDAIIAGATRQYPGGRFRGVDRILFDDVGIIAAAWIRKEPNREPQIRDRLRGIGVEIPQQPSLRFVLSWETDANDVDFHIYDGQGGHAYYSSRQLPSGGELYADVTTGYGPECFNIPQDNKHRAYPYTLQAHYYSRGPMGYGMGKLQIVEHDGKGGLKFVDRPFIIMVDRAYVDLGTVPAPLP